MLRCDDLFIKNLKIYQDTDCFCFGTDSVMLSHFAKIKKNDAVIDLGSGNGIIPLLLYGLYGCENIFGVEIQQRLYDLFVKNVGINSLEGFIHPIHSDLNSLSKDYHSCFDAVVTNPPYKEFSTGLTSENDRQKIARHEIYVTLRELIEKSSKLLKSDGSFFMVNRPERLSDALRYMEDAKIMPKEIRFVYSKISKEPQMFLVYGKKAANKGLRVLPPIILMNEDGTESRTSREIYSFMRKNK